jgi:hypothetical protein
MAGGYFEAEQPVGFDDGGDLFQATETLRHQLDKVARHILAARKGDARPDSHGAMVFLVSGPWGSGKSSALRYIQDYVAAEAGGDVAFAWYRAPLYQANPGAVRASLLFEVITALQRRPPGTHAGPDPATLAYRELTGKDFTFPPGMPKEQALPILTQRLLAQALDSSINAGTVVEAWLARYQTLTSDPPLTTVLLVDDLDRCDSTKFVKELLVATNYWSDIPNHFFILAADESRVRHALGEHVVGAPESPDHGLAKYVHLSVRLPATIPSREHAISLFRRYLGNVELAGEVRDLLTAELDAAPGSKVGMLDPLLWGCTPRTLKERFNSLLATLAPPDAAAAGTGSVVALAQDTLKRQVVRTRWPNEYASHLRPVELGQWPQSLWLRHLVDVGKRSLAQHPIEDGSDDLHPQQEAVLSLARESGLDLHGTDPLLALYLASEPRAPGSWYQLPGESEPLPLDPIPRDPDWAGGGGSREPGSIRQTPTGTKLRDIEMEPVPADGGMPDEREAQLYLLAAKSELPDVAGMLAAFQQAAPALTDLPPPADRWAPLLGNVALRMARHGRVREALFLHRLAMQCDPSHSNVVHNFVDFVLDNRLEEYYDVASEELVRFEAGDQLPFRTRLYRYRIEQRTGRAGSREVPEFDVLAREAITDHTAASRAEFVDLLRLGQTLARYELLPDLSAALLRYERGELREQAGTVRILADALAAAPDRTNEEYACELYRFLLRSGMVNELSPLNQSDTLQNLATLLASRKLPRPAGYLLWQAYQLEQTPRTDLRIKLARSYNELGDPATAAALLDEGQVTQLSDPPARPPFPQPLLPEHPPAQEWLREQFPDAPYGEPMLDELWEAPPD